MAKPGYGKRSAPDQQRSRRGDFAHLPPREAYLAGLIDRLPENAAMDAKTLAKAQPLYGQQAVRTALNELGRAGHLRRVRRRVPPGEGETGTRWVFLTYWSRTARDDEWWARGLEGDVTPEGETRPVVDDVPSPSRASQAYDTLARLGLREPRLALSAADCAALEELADAWLARGASPEQLTQVLVAGLPDPVHAPRAFLRRRLVDRMPPERSAPAPAPAPRTLMECTDCRVPGRPEALSGGLCRACRGGDGGGADEQAQARSATVRAWAAQVRTAIRTPATARPSP
ncbi:hypothetical protein [Streptomyces sp. Act143]|uniref:hypothetical protein n=1 Tax=Streptomyces sp. Act143 TaxID=2200760 RepID=UPI00215A4041|nr:hypothetical protein [Streptomyces sp. Act143]